ncbi:hypothetical protein R5R35_007859 [Gryllus longicercus]|uniref:Uncharacterized protein n=1 Tax=Gryllus longicercus TaxID=2509291 RepID=A0AAN9V9G6_9ORTH
MWPCGNLQRPLEGDSNSRAALLGKAVRLRGLRTQHVSHGGAMKTWAVLLSVVLLLLALGAESRPKGGGGGSSGGSRGWGGGWGRGSSGYDSGGSKWHSPSTTSNDYFNSKRCDKLRKQFHDYLERFREITSNIKNENDPNTNTSRIANMQENVSLKKPTGSSKSEDDYSRRLSGTTDIPDSRNLQSSNIGSSQDLENLPSQSSNTGSSQDLDNLPSQSSNTGSSQDIYNVPSRNSNTDSSKNVDELYRVTQNKSTGDWSWLSAAAVAAGTRPRAQGLWAPEFHTYHRRPGWRGALADFFETSSEDGRMVVEMEHQDDNKKPTCVDPSCSSEVSCQVLCTPVACTRTDELPCNFTCVATTCTKTEVMLNSAETASICDGEFTTNGSCNSTQRVVDCNGFGASCNFTCSAVSCSTTGGFCNFTCPSVPCNTGESSSCTLLRLNVTNVWENQSSSNFTCKVDSCDNTERSCNHSCTVISSNSSESGQPTEEPDEATEDFVLTTTGVPSEDVSLLSQDLTENTTPSSIEDTITESI